MFDTSLVATHTARAAEAPNTKADRAEAFLKAPPSRKIRFAVDDLEAAERSPHYAIDMDTWHAPDNTSNICYVCFAGAVMANRHAIRPDQIYVGPFDADSPNEYAADQRWDDLFSALDEFRTGYVEAFLTMDNSVPSDTIAEFAVTHSPCDPYGCFPGHVDYEDNPTAFKKWARDMADKLEVIGH
ncbi:MAG: hypothetical protein ACR2PI_07280 [Hyphomicrobiaceae bacterium]